MKERNVWSQGLGLFLNSLLATFFCVLACSVLIFTNGTFWSVVAQVILLVIYFGMLYSTSWQLGYKDRLYDESYQRERRPLKGLKIALIAMIPFAAFFALMLIAKYADIPVLASIYRILNAQYLIIINAIIDSAQVSTITSIFLSVREVPILSILAVFALDFLLVPFSWGMYDLGYRKFSLHDALVYKKEK